MQECHERCGENDMQDIILGTLIAHGISQPIIKRTLNGYAVVHVTLIGRIFWVADMEDLRRTLSDFGIEYEIHEHS